MAYYAVSCFQTLWKTWNNMQSYDNNVVLRVHVHQGTINIMVFYFCEKDMQQGLMIISHLAKVI